MTVAFSGKELINIAIGIEKKGIAFYDIMSRSTRSAKARSVFNQLVDMERNHVKIFQGMANEADKYQPPEANTGEYDAYFQALIDSAVFTDDVIDSQAAIAADNDIKAVELGIGAEKDSIIFYYQMKDLMSGRAQPTVDKILSEEKSHLRQLSELKKDFSES
ncbi:MAG: hypothetical protein FJ025_01190 [Chloroflexi bacterium]|nr:hypothetical protein [Chloroflexota bacterium]